MNIELTSRKSLTEVTEWYGFAVRIQMPSDAKDTTQNSPELKNIFNKLKKRKKKPVGKRRMEAVRILKVSENKIIIKITKSKVCRLYLLFKKEQQHSCSFDEVHYRFIT